MRSISEVFEQKKRVDVWNRATSMKNIKYRVTLRCNSLLYRAELYLSHVTLGRFDNLANFWNSSRSRFKLLSRQPC